MGPLADEPFALRPNSYCLLPPPVNHPYIWFLWTE
jgi:hypothetical protein